MFRQAERAGGGTVFLGHTWVLLGLLLGPRICRNFAEPMVEPPAGSGLVGGELTRSARGGSRGNGKCYVDVI
jgi:hypothetical protein